MGIDARGWFDIEGKKITADDLGQLKDRLLAASFDLQDRTNWFVLRDGFVEINFDCDRYYGPGYERGGNFVQHATILGWLLRNLPPGGRVFFGGDTSDLEELSEWTLEREREYLDHYFRVGFEPYHRPRVGVPG